MYLCFPCDVAFPPRPPPACSLGSARRGYPEYLAVRTGPPPIWCANRGPPGQKSTRLPRVGESADESLGIDPNEGPRVIGVGCHGCSNWPSAPIWRGCVNLSPFAFLVCFVSIGFQPLFFAVSFFGFYPCLVFGLRVCRWFWCFAKMKKLGEKN